MARIDDKGQEQKRAYDKHKIKLIQETKNRENNIQIVQHMNTLEQTIIDQKNEIEKYKKFFKDLNKFLPNRNEVIN